MLSQISERTTSGLGEWRSGEPRSLLRRIGDVLTLVAVFLTPMYGLVLGGLGYGDVVFALVIIVRILQFATEGLPVWEVRRHGFLVGVFCVFAIGGTTSGLLTGAGVPWEFIRIVIATIGSALIVATYGQTEESLLPLVRAFALGCLVLALSGLLGDQTDGRSTGFSIHPNGLAHSCLLGAAAGTYLLFAARHRWEKRLWAAAAALPALAIILVTGSRGSLLGLWLGAFLLLVLGGDRRLNLVAVGLTYLGVIAVATGVLSLPASNPISRLSDDGGSAEVRTERLEENLEDVAESPITGKGWKDIIAIHVVYLQGWVGGGALCGLSLIVLGAGMFVLPFGQSRYHLPLACGAAAIALAWLFTTVLTTRDQWLYLALAFRLCKSPVLSFAGRRLG